MERVDIQDSPESQAIPDTVLHQDFQVSPAEAARADTQDFLENQAIPDSLQLQVIPASLANPATAGLVQVVVIQDSPANLATADFVARADFRDAPDSQDIQEQERAVILDSVELPAEADTAVFVVLDHLDFLDTVDSAEHLDTVVFLPPAPVHPDSQDTAVFVA